MTRCWVRCYVGIALVVAGGWLIVPALQAQTSAEPVSRSWRQVVTPAYTVVSEGGEGTLRDTVAAVETFRAAMRQVFPAARLDPIVPTYLLVFDSRDSFTPFKPLRDGRRRTDVAGYALFDDDVIFMVMGRSQESTATYRIVFHEYTHHVLRRTFASLPTWYAEGIGELFSTLAGSTHDSRAIVGRPIPYYVETLMTEGVLPLRDMFVEERAVKQHRERTQRFYATSWLMAHYFLLDPGRQQALMALFGRQAKGTDLETGVKESLGMSIEQLQVDVTNYLRRARMPAIAVTVDSAQGQRPVERIPENTLARLQGDLLTRLGDHKAAERAIDGALARSPANDGLRTAKARLLVAQERPADAVAFFAADSKADPRSADSLRAEGAALIALDKFDDAAAVLSRAEAMGPPSAALLYQVGRVNMARAAWPQATTTFARLRVVDADPKWDLARAFEAYRLGYGLYVLGPVRTFISRMGWANPSSPYAALAGVLGLLRDKRNDDAAALLREMDTNTADDLWPAPVAAFLQQQQTAAALFAGATSDRERTEARAYVGLAASAAGRREEALEHLTWVKDKGETGLVEHRWAVAELTRLSAGQDLR